MWALETGLVPVLALVLLRALSTGGSILSLNLSFLSCTVGHLVPPSRGQCKE